MYKYKRLIKISGFTATIPDAPEGCCCVGVINMPKGDFAVYIEKEKRYLA